jgi:ABC-type antimicrobial peptide transport system permease subunit
MLVARFDAALYGFDGARAHRLARDITSRLSGASNLVVTTTDRAPFAMGYPRTRTISTSTIDCGATRCKPIVSYAVGARYLEAAGIPLRAGRDFTDDELKTGSGVIVNDALSQVLWPGRSALGQIVRIGPSGPPVTVVGVVADVEQGLGGQPAAPLFYEPIRDADLAGGFTLIARTTADGAGAAAAIRNAVRAVAPTLPVASLTTMNELLELPMWPRRTAAGFFVVCGGLALILATVGLFGVVFFAVRQRTREFGIRIALGARGADVVRQVLHEGVRLALTGAAVGLIAAAIAGRLLARFLLGVSAADPVSFAGAAAIEIAVAVLACSVPARDATRADPIVALRTE